MTKAKDTAAEARYIAFLSYYEEGLKQGTIKSKSDFARQLGVAANTINVALRDKRVTRTLFLRLQGLAAGLADAGELPDGFVQIPAEEYEQMRATIANLSATTETQARVIALLTQDDFDKCEKTAE